VELFEIIRREYEFGEGTISGVARKLGVHRRMVRDAISQRYPAGAKEARSEGCGVGPNGINLTRKSDLSHS